MYHFTVSLVPGSLEKIFTRLNVQSETMQSEYVILLYTYYNTTYLTFGCKNEVQLSSVAYDTGTLNFVRQALYVSET